MRRPVEPSGTRVETELLDQPRAEGLLLALVVARVQPVRARLTALERGVRQRLESLDELLEHRRESARGGPGFVLVEKRVVALVLPAECVGFTLLELDEALQVRLQNREVVGGASSSPRRVGEPLDLGELAHEL